ncbi:MerR family transcriptional regulator [Nakamurella aerolata]|uniref:MerR family transcriptional regulator n=1 Tax=Nakamurella aerolata TaxID=1656892 RepID=A0A849ACF5_9ACTN|nr:MerR family transcriptional regulator [Nakamurella aerolata]NNG36170.1 MerR family transcriptional regulator [Nakamurella aerolata]
MRISELAERTGVSVPTLKFYLREGLLDKGETTAATRAEYGAEHVDRVRLISALTAVRELPLARVRDILRLIDHPADDPVLAMGAAVSALPPYVLPADAAMRESADPAGPEPADTRTREPGDPVRYPRARRAIELLGMEFDPNWPATAQLEAALLGLEQAGLPWDDARAKRYGAAMLSVAKQELKTIAAMTPQQAVSYSVLGTALYEPVLLALRRLAHRSLIDQMAPGAADAGPDAATAPSPPAG